jgi:hypothetical protein
MATGRSLHLDICVFHGILPTGCILEHETAERFRRAGHEHQAFVGLDGLEDTRPDRFGDRRVLQVHDIRSRSRRRVETIPAFDEVTGHAGLGNRRQVGVGC